MSRLSLLLACAMSFAACTSASRVRQIPQTYTPLVQFEPNENAHDEISATAAPSQKFQFHWVSMGPRDLKFSASDVRSGKFQAFGWSPALPDVMFAGGGLGSGIEGPFTQTGVYRSDDRGHSWTSVNNGLTDSTINVLWVDPIDASVVLAGTEFGGLFRSTTRGDLWIRVLDAGPVSEFVDTPLGLLAGTKRGVELSTDKGATWSVLKATTSPVRALAFGADNIMAGLERGQVLIRNAQGEWREVAVENNFSIWDLAIDPVDPKIAFYIRAQGPGPLKVAQTRDGGATWNEITPPTATYTQVLVIGADRAVYVAGQGMLFKSRDSGVSWERLTAPWDSRSLFLLPSLQALVVGSDHGLQLSNDDGHSWRHLTSGISANIVFGAALAGSTIVMTMQDFGPIGSFDGGTSWSPYFGEGMAEGGSVAINPGNPQLCYLFTNGGLLVSEDGCHKFGLRAGPRWENYVSAGNANLITVDPHNPARVFVGAADGVWSSSDWGKKFSHLDWPVAKVTQVVVDPANAGVIYVCSTEGLSRSSDGGTTWTKLNLESDSYPMSLSVSPADSRLLMVALNRPLGDGDPSWAGGVKRSIDGGRTFQWVNDGLSREVFQLGEAQLSIAFGPSVPGSVPLVALATSSGIYISDDLGGHWQNVGNGAITRYFSQVQWQGGVLWATTFGQGVIHSDRPLVSMPRRRAARH